jgi:acyl-CoA thioester hydrolase
MSKNPLSPRSAYAVWRDIPTRLMDNDIYGHVNNVIYYSWIDTAVNQMLIDSGLLDMARGDPIGLIVESGCRFARPVSFPQVMQLGVRVAHIGTSSVRYEVGIFAVGVEEAAAEGFLVHVYVDRTSRRPKPLGAEWRSYLDQLMQRPTL